MNWFDTLKFHPELRRLSGGEELKVIALGDDESKVKEMWDVSNPDDLYELRDSNARTAEYPVDEWFGVIIQQGDKHRLVAISGFAVKQGKEGKKYAYKGGTKSSVGGMKYGETARDKAIDNLRIENPSIPTISGYTTAGSKWKTGTQPETDEVIPDAVLEHFREHYSNNWDVQKWFVNLRG